MIEAFHEVNQYTPWFFPTFAFIIGACVGSFLNVCIYRIPKGESVVSPPSHCGCGKRIAWYDNIPIFSWFILRGRARCCGAHFSFRYPFVEILTGVIFLLCWLQASPLVAVCWMLFASLMVCATFVDFDTMTIPDRCSIGGLILGVVLSTLVPQLHGFAGDPPPVDNLRALIVSVQGAFIGSALLYWIMVLAEIALGKPAMGEGDVKLMGAIGAFCGWEGAVFALFGGAMLGTLAYFSLALARLILGKPLRGPGARANGETDAEEEDDSPEGAVPFGPALAAAALLYLLFFHGGIDFYFHDIGEMLFP